MERRGRGGEREGVDDPVNSASLTLLMLIMYN
jgi:hypothetical protein